MKEEAHDVWRAQAASVGWSHETVLVSAPRLVLTDAERHENAYRRASEYLSREFITAAVLDHERLRVHAARGLIPVGAPGGRDDVEAVVRMIEDRGFLHDGTQVALISGRHDHAFRISHSAQVQIEQAVSARAKEAALDRSQHLSDDAIFAAVAAAESADGAIQFSREQRAAIHALGQGGAFDAHRRRRRRQDDAAAAPGGRLARRHAVRPKRPRGDRCRDGLAPGRCPQDAGIRRTYALSPLLAMIDSGEFKANRNTVLVLDEASQIGPRPLLKLFELQAKTGMTIKMLGDREQAQAIEAGDSIEILRRALPPEALPELLTTMRQATHRGREIAGLFREGEAAQALDMKRADGHAMMVGGDRDQVVAQIADLYIARRDILGSGSKRGITVSAPTNEDVAEISLAIRQRLKARGEIGGDETLHGAIDQRGQEYDLALAAGDRVRLFRRTWGTVDGREQQVGNNGDVVEVLAQNNWGLRIRTERARLPTSSGAALPTARPAGSCWDSGMRSPSTRRRVSPRTSTSTRCRAVRQG